MKKGVKYFLDWIRSPDEKKFAELHPIERHSDRNGNKGDVFGGSNITAYNREAHRQGYNSDDDEMHYEEFNQLIDEALILERHMSDAEMSQREDYVHSMKRNKGDFKKRYGKNWKSVMYATATKMAMKEDVPEFVIEEFTEIGGELPVLMEKYMNYSWQLLTLYHAIKNVEAI